MTMDELWQLFPIMLKEHDTAYFGWYAEEERRLARLSKRIRRISHIGSTAVPGLLCKPTVDILLEMDGSCDNLSLAEALKREGWLMMDSQYTPVYRQVLNKGYTPDGFAERVYHLHVRYFGDWDELYFRDYLLDNADIAAEYAALKQRLLRDFEHNRDGYTEAKSAFIHEHTQAARKIYRDKYKRVHTADK